MKKLLLVAALLMSGNVFSAIGGSKAVRISLQEGTRTPIEITNPNLKITIIKRGLIGALAPQDGLNLGTDRDGNTVYLSRADENLLRK